LLPVNKPFAQKSAGFPAVVEKAEGYAGKKMLK